MRDGIGCRAVRWLVLLVRCVIQGQARAKKPQHSTGTGPPCSLTVPSPIVDCGSRNSSGRVTKSRREESNPTVLTAPLVHHDFSFSLAPPPSFVPLLHLTSPPRPSHLVPLCCPANHRRINTPAP
ncbi:hypothetical protein HDK77DRAFT_68544 [Phyllosticta capitalensis]|uniref:Secreted protein n=1 Tax=Phyllosticta capitalensis TaxID=121624 RepID=A0ABR1YQV1_9PEZI